MVTLDYEKAAHLYRRAGFGGWSTFTDLGFLA